MEQSLLALCPSFIFVAVIKYPKDLREKRAHFSLQFWDAAHLCMGVKGDTANS